MSFRTNQIISTNYAYQKSSKQGKDTKMPGISSYSPDSTTLKQKGSVFQSIPEIIQQLNAISQEKQKNPLSSKYHRVKYCNPINSITDKKCNPFVLNVEFSESTIQQDVKHKKSIRYKKQGLLKQLVTNNRNLKDKISQLKVKEAQKQVQLSLLASSDNQRQQQNVNNLQVKSNQFNQANQCLEQKEGKTQIQNKQIISLFQRRTKNTRYFYSIDDTQAQQPTSYTQQQNLEIHIKCHRCGKLGHIERMCWQSPFSRCTFCLGNHRNIDCVDLLCWKCNQKIHINSQCQCPEVQCYRCHKLGHKSRNCGKIIQKELNEADLSKVKCLKCKELGHFNCHKYVTQIPCIYPTNKVVK